MRRQSSTSREAGVWLALTLLLAGCAGAGTDNGTADDVAAVEAPLEAIAATGVPWCIPDPDNPGAEMIVGAGADIQVKCTFRSWLLHQAGTTILVGSPVSSPAAQVSRVAESQLTELGPAPGPNDVMMSHDGRLVAWLTSGGTNCAGFANLWVFEVATATQTSAATLSLPTTPCFRLGGIDDLGRVYVTTSPREEPGTDVYMNDDVYTYDPGSDTWTKVIDLPGGQITYITANGIAIASETATLDTDEYNEYTYAVASVEGIVDADGRFAAQRQVPVGNGLWSPDRSMVVHWAPEGALVRAADDLDRPVTLDFPSGVDGSPDSPSGLQWTPDGSVLLSTAGDGPDALDTTTYRCDPQSGACEVVSTVGHPAFDALSGKPG